MDVQFKPCQHYCVIRQKHLNQYGSVFGGHVLSMIDELAFVACERAFPGMNFVTRALQDVEFHNPAHLGDILELNARVAKIGRSSCQVRVRVTIHSGKTESENLIFDGTVIMVCVDEQGNAQAIPNPR